ncbi:hypothetical protein C8R46DRAFT_1092964, partial [Mycena filopes]
MTVLLGRNPFPLLGETKVQDFHLGSENYVNGTFLQSYQDAVGSVQTYMVRGILVHVEIQQKERILVLGPPPKITAPLAHALFLQAEKTLDALAAAYQKAYHPSPNRLIYETRRWTAPGFIFVRLSPGATCISREVSVDSLRPSRPVWEDEIPFKASEEDLLTPGAFLNVAIRLFHADVPLGPSKVGPQVYFSTQGSHAIAVERVGKTTGRPELHTPFAW